jgi:predicted acylesterase/phospholipase RssA
MTYEELVISSGGIYIVHYVGALLSLNKYFPLHYFKYYTGCSAGSIISLLLVCGYSIEELYEEILNLDITEYQDIKIANFLEEYGFDNGEKFYILFKKYFDKKNINHNITFLELFEKTHKILTFSVTNITKQCSEYHNVFSTPYMKVIDSLLMSMNIPILFKPIKKTLTYMGNYQENHYYLDGALLDPFPWKVIKKINPSKKIGIFQHNPNQNNNIIQEFNFMSDFQSYFMKIIKTFEKDMLKEKYKFLKDEKNVKNIFMIHDPNINMIDFQMSPEIKKLYIKDTEQKFEIFYLHKQRTQYLSHKYFYLWYQKIKNKK